jgi:hypothetical protein
VPYEVLSKLTEAEWKRVQGIDGALATEILTLPRTITPTMDEHELEIQIAISKDGEP